MFAKQSSSFVLTGFNTYSIYLYN